MSPRGHFGGNALEDRVSMRQGGHHSAEKSTTNVRDDRAVNSFVQFSSSVTPFESFRDAAPAREACAYLGCVCVCAAVSAIPCWPGMRKPR
jgi:hypothetical protein